MKKSGFTATKSMLNRVTPEVEAQFEAANRDNAEMIVDLAKVLIPEKTGTNRALIRNIPGEDGSQLIDFGPKAKVIEGKRGPRPFVNPALAATKKKRVARNRKAIKKAIKAVS
ncbi:MAG TPA: hypothetical protein ENH56_05715 [Roseobacter sp.]|uniref:HK97 gp10 family phage protein n=1 Tax=marine sediment metagenome TaxID=412755 RepID=A0A0F9SS67_9ZZZZ|nr:hypothetical protein [Roseobacter sp.]